MASFYPREWVAVISHALQGLKFMPRRARLDRAAQLQELAGLLFHFERQMGRARIEQLGRTISMEQFQALWRHQIQSIDLLLRKAALPESLPKSLLAERVLRTVKDWDQTVEASALRPLLAADLRRLQHRLEDLAEALAVYAKAEHEQWCDTEPSL